MYPAGTQSKVSVIAARNDPVDYELIRLHFDGISFSDSAPPE
jgi:hypothetical protein